MPAGLAGFGFTLKLSGPMPIGRPLVVMSKLDERALRLFEEIGWWLKWSSAYFGLWPSVCIR